MTKKIIILIILVVLLSPLAATASERGKNILFTVEPATPGAFTNTTISIRSFMFNLVASEITWYLDGVEYAKDFNLSTIDFITENWGNPTEVKAQAKLISGKTLTEAITIYPARVDLLWHANSYIPAFYEGKRLATSGNTITVTAEPTLVSEKGLVDPKALIYEWQKNNEKLISASGINKKTLSYIGGQTTDNINIKVSTQNGRLVAENKITIEKVKPFITLYETKPLSGLNWLRSIRTGNKLTGEDITLKAEPYFFNTNTGADNLVYNWTINDKVVAGREDSKKLLTLINDSLAGEQKITLGLNIKNRNQPLQTAQKNIELWSSYYSIGF
ncbi:MAG: hypothetical protein A2571_00715 [Candidatus Vogelbacteria bacterium RIFOXYD1_FULL_44_32]|uniref:BIG2 domain-containing protein n=1 Tax=Candidatus Vogelbacteria bacterium RIFOXYD1_FULL_44_32 TaxID=1802438 RepID=A0A1G2QFQ9_9BACT|nr:MAG: hypothetical protein A2571_00715 [Candidatus Vogelbacteria bacterium RIFOXYD1_FULL_44_32]